MRVASALLVAGIFAFSASSPHASFRYEVLTSFRRLSTDTCRICYGDDCTTLDESRCEYYVEVDEILDKPEEDGEVTEVDAMMYELTQQVTMPWAVQTCIPLISYYSDCTKENICVGCKTCSCTSYGQWSCTQVQKCHPNVEQDVDHRTLVVVIEKLMDDETRRKKRSVNDTGPSANENNSLTEKTEVKNISLVDIAEWMYGVRPNKNTADLSDNIDKVTGVLDGEYLTQFVTSSSKPTESEYLNFEEVLKNIATENQTNNRKKSQLQGYESIDYMNLDNIKIEKSNSSNQFINMLNAIEQGDNEEMNVKDNTDDTTFVVDLYPHKNNLYNENKLTDKMDVNSIYNEDNNTIDYTSNDKVELNAINIMKRDTSSVTDVSNVTEATTTSPTTISSTTDMDSDLKNNVLIPLTTIINDKQNEIKELLSIKENLVGFVKTCKNINITKVSETTNGSNTYFSIYKLDLITDIQENLRRINPNVLDKLLYKLKRDIYEVLRDIISIQKNSNIEDLPFDLKMLIRSMKYYIHSQGSIRDLKIKDIKLDKNNSFNTRRLWTHPIASSSKTVSDVKNQIIDILQVLDKGMPQMNVLALLSKSTKKIMKRVIEQHFDEEFSAFGSKMYDTGYNLSENLKRIGKNWPQLTVNLERSTPHEKLYAMKLLHFTLSGDIRRMTDAIALVDFAHSRRMVPIETPIAERLMDKIYSGLDLIRTKVQYLISYQSNRAAKNDNMRANAKNTKKKIKDSFLKKIRNLLKHSKKDIINMAKKKMPKTDIVKTIAEKKFTEQVKENMFKQTMLRWQKNLNVISRKRRDLEAQLKSMRNRIKNIIPKYLRGKINPAMVKKRQAKKHLVNKKKTTNNRKNVTKNTTKTKTTSNKHNNTKSRTQTVTNKKNADKQKGLTTPKTILNEEKE